MLINLMDFYLKILHLNVFKCFALQHFGLKKEKRETFHCTFFCFISSMKERVNAFNNEN